MTLAANVLIPFNTRFQISFKSSGSLVKLDIPDLKTIMPAYHRKTGMTINTYDAFNRPSAIEKNKIARFLHKHLEQYGDSLTAINKCIDYAIKESPSFGGFILTLKEKSKIVGAVIVNQTGMNDYIPENILVYIAIHNEHRGEGLGRKLMTAALDKCQGSVALHVEHDNPALHLYKNLGFENKYLEMRLTRK